MSRISRRSFLGLGRAKAEDTAPSSSLPSVISWLGEAIEDDPPARQPRPMPLLRPPGAIEEAAFLERCTKCSDCRDACPHQAIVPAPLTFRAAAGTPWIDPSVQPCRLCEDLPCLTACTTGALAGEGDVMGTAFVKAPDCLVTLGTSCSVCKEQCPSEGAISFERGIPTIQPRLCTGCGICHYVCPAPTKAIFVLPNDHRGHRPEVQT